MTPAIEHYNLLLIAYWLAMLLIATVIMIKVAGYCTDEYPASFRRAVLIVLATAAAVFFAYDAAGYFFALWMRDPVVGVRMPPNYTYWDWLREPIALKWQVLGFVPFIRFIPVGIALIVGCVIQIFLWNVPFKLGAVVFMAQVVLNLVAMVLLSFLFRLGIALYERAAPRPEPARAGEVRGPEDVDPRAAPSGLSELARRVKELAPGAGPVWRRLDAGWESVNGHLRPLYGLLQPVTDHLPAPAQDFLNAGGWVPVLVGAATLALLWPRVHRHRKQLLRSPARRHHRSGPRVQLAMIGDAVSGLGPQQATVRGSPARLRLVIVAPPAAATGTAAPEPLAELLESIRPELGPATESDYPHVEVWTDPHAREHFRQALETRVEFPELPGHPSRWVLLTGQTTRAGSPVQVALGFFVNEPTTARVIEIPAGHWPEVVGLRDVPAEERD
jgi:hypothetical protein